MKLNTLQHDVGTAGFTLIEMLVTLTILAAVVAIAYPVITRPSDRFALLSAKREVLAALRLTRSAAITRNKQLTVTFDTELRSYRSDATGKGALPHKIELALKIADTERQSPAQGAFRFYPDGSSTGGELTLARQDERAKICVNWLTGLAEQSESC